MIHEKNMDKLEFIKIKYFYSAKDNIKRIRRQATDWEKLFAKDISDKELLAKIYKDPFKLNNKKTNNPIKNWVKHLKRHLTKEDIQMAKKSIRKDALHHISSGKWKSKQQ